MKGMMMKSRKIYAFILFPVILALIYGGCGGSGGDNPQPTPRPSPTPAPTSKPTACNSPSLNTAYVDGDDTNEFYVYNAAGSTLDTHLYSDGKNVFVLVSDGSTTFGFSGVPTGAGTACEFIKASADYDNDGVFDETAKSFISSCLRLDDGGQFTYLEGPSKVDASQEFEDRLLYLYNQVAYYNVLDTLGCDQTEPVPDSGIYEPLLLQLQTEINAI